MLGAGGGAGIVPQLHGQTALHLRHGHGLVIDLARGGHLVGGLAHDIQRFLRQTRDHRAVILAGDQRGDLPVGQGDILGKNIVDAAGHEALRRALDNVQIRHDQRGRLHRDRLLLSVHDHGADTGRKSVGTGERRNGDKGDAQLVGGIAAEVHDGAGTEGHENLGIVELGHHILDQYVLRTQTLRGQDDLLIGLEVLAFRQSVNEAVVYYGAALIAKAHRRHVLLKAAERVVFDDDHLGLQLVVTAAAAFADVLGTIHNHKRFLFLGRQTVPRRE